MRAFAKRRFHGFGLFWGEVKLLWPQRKALFDILRGKALSPGFRERLMLAVTAVNQCRFCTFVHSRIALKEGVSKAEVDDLFRGEFEGVPEEERTAVLYAHHWAETEGRPDAEATDRLKAAYGEETSRRIDATLRFINLNNRIGNTFDWLLYTLSFGKVGGS
jgi:AhpD family alkylhydroperoxidase